jgi:hypothetical protein
MSDSEAILQLMQASKIDVPHSILHYLYFPSEISSITVTSVLRESGFLVEQRLGADCSNWLVLAQHDIIPSEENVSTARAKMEDVAKRYGGEYDGWEAEMK